MTSKKVYIAAPFRGVSARSEAADGLAYGELRDEAMIEMLQDIEAAFLDYEWQTCLPHRDEGHWGARYYEPRAIGALCLRHVDTSDLICAIPGRSRGVHIELGRASSPPGLPVIAFRREDEESSTLLPGVGIPARFDDRLPSRGELLEVVVESYTEIPGRVRHLLARSSRSIAREERRLGIVDLGSNSVKLSVYSVRPGRRPIEVRRPERESISIADGVRSTGLVSRQSLEQLDKILGQYSSFVTDANATAVVVGTEALRQAQNIEEVEALVDEYFGVGLRLLTQQAEADAVASAVRSSISTTDDVSVLNLGASSVQIVAGITSDRSLSYLLRFGTKDLTARHPWHKAMSSAEWTEVYEAARTAFASAGLAARQSPAYLFHTGGELDFLLRCEAEMETSRISPTHVSMMSVDAFSDFAAGFAARRPEDVAEQTDLAANWLAGSVASNAIALAAAAALGVGFIVPSNLNVADGLLQ
ncbi:MAG TPA: hypothetical protein VMA72_08795 [Streptosporangiaceae bacterium]|nr:hypothetical protein [Streptosporangiaceae bacterium]